MAQPAEEWITPEEYLRRERLSETKHEYLNGRMYPLGHPPEPPAGGVRRRALILTNLVAALRDGLRGQACETYGSGVAVGGVDFDIVVAREPEFEGERMLLNPLAAFLIVSSGSEGPHGRLWEYEAVASVQEVWFVWRERRLVVTNQRLGPLRWIVRFVDGGDATSEALGIEVSLDQIYERVRFEPEPPIR